MPPMPDTGESPDLAPLYEQANALRALPPGWEDWLIDAPPDDLPLLDDLFTIDEAALELPASVPDPAHEPATLEHWLQAVQAESDGLHPLNNLLETGNLPTEESALQVIPEPSHDLIDARFLGRADLNDDGTVADYTMQNMEVYRDPETTLGGRVLDVGQYETLAAASKVYDTLQESITDGTLTPADLPLLAEGLAEANGLPNDDWRDTTPDDYARYAEHSPAADTPDRDVPPETLVSDPAFTNNLFREAAADPAHAAEEQARLANEQALAALRGIGLTVQTDFNLARDSFYDAERGERLINGIFQQNPADATQDCRPMLVSLTTAHNGLGFAAQAVEFGQVGSLAEVQADHDRVQTALEQGGVTAGIAAVEALDGDLVPPIPEVSTWSREID